MRSTVCASIIGLAISGVTVLVGSAVADVRSASATVFSAQSFDDAMASSRRQGRLLVAMFSAEWCGPCKAMENSTWRDPGVAAWVRDHGVAIHIDVDVQRDIARRYDVRSLPLLIAFRDGEVVDRSLGFKDPRQMLDWLDRVARATPSGRAGIQAAAQAAIPAPGQAPVQIITPTMVRPAPKPVEPARDIVAEIRIQHARLTERLRALGGDLKAQNAARRAFREGVARTYAEALPGPRSRAVLAEATRMDDTAWMRIALVQAALDAGKQRREHLQLLEEAGRLGADVSRTQARLRAALGSTR